MLLKTINKTKQIFSFILVLVILCGSFSVEVLALTASEKQEYKDEIAELKKEIEENKKKIDLPCVPVVKKKNP